jgi:hypothetical protein
MQLDEEAVHVLDDRRSVALIPFRLQLTRSATFRYIAELPVWKNGVPHRRDERSMPLGTVKSGEAPILERENAGNSSTVNLLSVIGWGAGGAMRPQDLVVEEQATRVQWKPRRASTREGKVGPDV